MSDQTMLATEFDVQGGPFDDLWNAPIAPAPQLVDRTTLQGYAECPFAQWAKDHLLVMPDCSEPATVGDQCHEAISATITDRIAGASYADMLELLRTRAEASRPDVQPAACEALRYGARTVAGIVCYQGDGEERHPEDILRYDGGTGQQSGQLAMDYQCGDATYRLTGEVDLLVATISPTVLELDDWKCGRKWWTPTDVAASFQFQFYAELVFRNYPGVEQVNVRVVMPAHATMTEPVEFRTKDRARIRARLMAALERYHAHHAKPTGEGIPCHPLPERCAWCPACVPGKCPLVRSDAKRLPDTPEAMLEALAATEQAAKRLAGLLTERVRDTGREIECGKLRFGIGKPKEKKAPKCEVYETNEGSK